MTEDEATLYSLVHDGAPGDLEFYRAQTDARRVLELGCGWGRVGAALACEEVVGLERDPGMRALAARHGFEALDGDMRDFSVGRFDRVIIPFTGIYCLLSEADVAACLRCVRAALAPGGRLIFDAYVADAFHEESLPEDYPDDQLEEVAQIEHEGRALVVLEKSRWVRPTQRVDATYVYLDESDTQVAEIEVAHRYLLSSQIEPLLNAAGLQLVSMAGSFEGEPFDEDSGSIVVQAACAEEALALVPPT